MQNLLKKYEGFCKEPRIIDELKAYSEKCRKRIEESTKKWQELFKKFFEEGVTERFKAVCLKVKEEEERKINEEYKKFCEVWKNLEIEMIQTGGLEGVTDMNSSSFGAMGTPFEPEGKLKRKREEELDVPHGDMPPTSYATPSHSTHSPISGFMAEARQNYCQAATALATQGSLFSTNEGTQIQTREASHGKEASTSSWAPPQEELNTFTYDELGQGSIEELSLDDLQQDVTLDSSDWDTFVNSLLEPEMFAGNLADPQMLRRLP
ncbi:hypothetical protein SLEP1_g53046 [Rubroshorea leprosula]|uniref:Uncharacterized protein n=1 Tax=Rubroshorea leprosula TaxID=152421 RepID=A0AAV5M861_9ROSI|nr:hypothetical protein SLEP1_g53046 [Rubroshorea leprosula]